MNYAQFKWAGDHITIEAKKSKKDQKGHNSYPRAVFANPTNPSICPFLALGLQLICRPIVSNEEFVNVFPGKDPSSAFGKFFSKVLYF